MSVNVCEYNGTSCGATVYSATGSGTYAPPNHRIELGTRPRNETLIGARFRNFKVSSAVNTQGRSKDLRHYCQ